MTKKVNWGILGCAGIAERALIPAIAGSTNGRLYGIASRDPHRAADWAKRFGFERAYGGYAELIADPAVDAVYNPLPNHLHAPWSLRAVRAGKHVLCEKPMAMNAGEVREMAAAASASGVLLMEAFMYKFHPQIEKTLELIARGEVGGVRTVHSSFTFLFKSGRQDYRWFPEMGGGSLYDVGCYTTSVARLVFGEEPVSVFARARFDADSGVDIAAHALLEFPGGRFAHCDSAFDTQFQSRLLVAGDRGSIGLDRAFSAKQHDAEMRVVRGDEAETIRIPAANMFARMVEHFGEGVLEGTPLRYPAADAERNMRVIDACFESIKLGRPIDLT
jgi:predicted dehydrogenase